MIASAPAPANIYTIPPGIGFVDALAEGVAALHAGPNPLTLTRVVVLLPTRRAVRALTDAFLRRAGNKPVLLPQMRTIGDIDDDDVLMVDPVLDGESMSASMGPLPAAVAPLRRQMLLAQLIHGWYAARAENALGRHAIGADQALKLASALADLIDQVHTAGVGFDRLADLVPDELADHWQETVAFLQIAATHWPKILADDGTLDPAARRNQALHRLAETWRREPPARPVIAAGSTGSVPATADLLAVVARRPGGCVVLPGLDQSSDDDAWCKFDESHPQFGLRQVLERLDVARAAVPIWPGVPASPIASARAPLVAEVMRPVETTDAWHALAGPTAAALDGLSVVRCADSQTEAGIIALMMREALEESGRTAALVTTDRGLARRVAGELKRWQITVDDSAGAPLAESVPGVFLRLLADVCATGLPPAPLLALLKHPLSACGTGTATCRRWARRLERRCLRGPRPQSGTDGLRAAAAAAQDAGLAAWVDGLAAAMAPLAGALNAPVADLETILRQHVVVGEWFATDDQTPGTARLWHGDAGEQLARFFESLAEAADVMPTFAGRDYPALLDTLLAGHVVRPRYNTHPRLHIWGPLEARLQTADLVILGGLNEGTWPRDAQLDPWLNRPLRRALGLPSPERMIGLAAHDFTQLFCTRQVALTRADKHDGVPTVPSRWLERLRTVIGQDRADGLDQSPFWSKLYASLDDSHAPPRPARPPAPKPPVVARPRQLSVTRIEYLMRDPYDVFAREILGLRSLDPIDADPGAADYGNAVHDALGVFVNRWPRELPDDAIDRLLTIGRQSFAPLMSRPGVWAFWWPRFERIAAWFVAHERDYRPGLADCVAEIRGQLTIDAPAGDFTITAVADRIDRLPDDTLVVTDYKTGAVPSLREVTAGYAPQLPLEAVIAEGGGFANVAAAPVAELRYWQLRGTDPVVKGGDPIGAAAQLAAEAHAGVARLIASFDDPDRAYHARPAPRHAPRFSDYEHLARVREWASGPDEVL